jgi:pyruvate formate lyase activating enzyme
LDCPWCQNWELSKHAPPAIDSGSPQHWTTGEYYTPEHFVDEAIERNCQGTSISLNEPTLSLEWSLEVFRLARQRGLYNTFVTNGYMTDIALEHLARAGLDGMNVDLKGDAQAVRAHCGADVEPIWRNLRRAQEQGIWVEVTTLIVPGVNAERAVWAGIAERILQELGPDVPWHVSRYHPAYRCSEPPTPVKVLEQIRATARERGLKYVYIGNVAGHPAEHTYCPACGEMLIQRWAVWSVANRMEQERCPRCGEKIAGRW